MCRDEHYWGSGGAGAAGDEKGGISDGDEVGGGVVGGELDRESDDEDEKSLGMKEQVAEAMDRIYSDEVPLEHRPCDMVDDKFVEGFLRQGCSCTAPISLSLNMPRTSDFASGS